VKKNYTAAHYSQPEYVAPEITPPGVLLCKQLDLQSTQIRILILLCTKAPSASHEDHIGVIYEHLVMAKIPEGNLHL
jgi:hypothetical protein